MKLLITGFEPFGGEESNASWAAVERLPGRIGPWKLEKRCLPVMYGEAFRVLERQMEALKPDAVICVGQAGGRGAITPERVAVNLRDVRIPDNAGAQPRDEAVDPQGPAAYFSTLPVRRMTEAIQAAGIPAALSLTAGAFVCNDLFYLLMRSLEGSGVPGGFIHVPAAKDLPTEQTALGLQAAITALLEQ